MVDPMDDDLILGPVTYFKFPTSTNGSEIAEDTGFDLSRVKTEPVDTYGDPYSNGYQTNNSNYHSTYFPGSFFPYQTPTQENNFYEQPVTNLPYNNYAMKQEIKLEPVDYSYHEQHVPANPFHNNYYNNHYLYPTQNNEFWHNSYPQVYGYPQHCYQQHAPIPLVINNIPKKRGRKKKVKIEHENLKGSVVSNNFPVDMIQLMSQQERAEQAEGKVVPKERRKHDRFNGMTEEEVSKRTLPDLLISNLDIVIIGINPGLFAAYKGHHYAGPGNHFWKCLYLSGLTSEPMTADDDYKLLQSGIGFTNMVERATKGSSDLTRKEIREGGQMLLEKLQRFKPKIAVFNGKLIFEVFSGKKEFNFGRQPDFVDGTNTYMWVMPSSSARCAQLPRASDKVPYYTALKKFRDYLNGAVSTLDENDIVFQYCKLKTFGRGLKEEQRSDDSLQEFEDDELSNSPIKSEYIEPLLVSPPTRKKKKSEEKRQMENPDGVIKKKRGRPKKIRPEIVAPVNNPSPSTSKYFEPCSPVFSPSYQQQYPSNSVIPSTPDNVNGYYTQNWLDSAFSTYDFHPSEIQSHLRSFLPSSRTNSQSQ